MQTLPRARQARARRVAAGLTALAPYGRALATALPTYPVEAATALGNSVQADELDDRCGVLGTRELAVHPSPHTNVIHTHLAWAP